MNAAAPGTFDTLDALCAALGRLRAEAGSPSYAEIARRIGAARDDGAEPGKVTVYDCFRPGRRRVDERLVGDIVLALRGTGAGRGAAGADAADPDDADPDDAADPAAEAERWRAEARRLNGDRTGVHIEAELGPRSAEAIVGRERALAMIPADAGIVVLSGLPGVGKSALASALAARDDATVLTVELRGSDRERPAAGPVDVLRRMLGALGHRSAPHDLAQLRERFTAAVAAHPRRLTVVFEDAASVERLAPLLVEAPGVRHLVTSRVDLGGLARHPGVAGRRIAFVEVAPLDAAASARLLDARIGDGRAVRGAMERIGAVAAGLPLDLVMLAATVREHPEWSLDDLAARFEDEPRDARMRPVLDAAFRALAARDARLLLELALVDRELDRSVLLAASGTGAEASAARLRAQHLLVPAGSRLRMHDTVFAFARDRALGELPRSERRSFAGRAADAVLDRLAEDAEYAARETGTVLAVAAAAAQHGLDAAVERLALAAHPGLAEWSMWGESLRLHDLAAGSGALESIPELALAIAQSAEKLGRYDEALMTLHRVRRVARGVALARTWNQIGNVERWTGRFEAALASYTRAIGIAAEAGDDVARGRATGNHADTLRIVARYAEAEAGYARALELALAAGDEVNEGIIRSNRALLFIATGRFDDAERELGGLIAAAGGRPLAAVRCNLALAAEARGDDVLAAERRADAERAARAAGEYSVLADLALLGARIDARAGRIEPALEVARDALAEAERAGSPLIATEAGNSLAEIEAAGGRWADAERHAREAGGIAEATGDAAEIARSRAVLALVAAASDRPGEAAGLADAARGLYAALGHRLAAAR